MPLPALELGLVVHYAFVWAGPGRPPIAADEVGKARPCLVVDIEDDAAARTKRVTYLPISHTPPSAGERAIAVPPRVAAHLGLTAETSWLYTSYAVEDDWPFDLEDIPGRPAGTFHHGLVPPAFFALVAADFAARLAAARPPGFVHRRSGG